MSEKDEKFVPSIPKHTERKQQQVQLLAKKGDDADWWADQMDQIAAGAGLEELAVALQVNYSVYRHWIMGDTKREKEYAAAIVERRKRERARVEDRLLKTALNPTGHPTHADANRAAEILLSNREGSNLQVPAGGISLNVMFVGAKDGKIENPLIEGNVIDQVP